MKSILDDSFEYVKSDQMGPDYLAKKFAKLKREQRKAAEEKAAQEKANEIEAAAKVSSIRG